jgi:two-component system, LytTR family, sensor histidine kinase AlgZ
MHPLNRNLRWLMVYILAWFIFGLMVAELLRFSGTVSREQSAFIAGPVCMFYAFVCLTPWYVARPLLRRGAPLTTHIFQHLGTAILACAMWLAATQAMAWIVGVSGGLGVAIPLLLWTGLLLYLLSIAVHYGMLAFESSREAAIQARDAELRALKSQIHPHFLFNSLNSISALTTADPARAREMAIRLSDFLRNTLGLGEKASILWRDEMELARTYLEVEKVRFGARLNVEVNVREECNDCQVPPLVLQPLIENAIRHGIATMVDGGTVRVEGRVEKGVLEVSVENEFDPESPAPRKHGHGLRNVQERLETRFGSAAGLRASSGNNQFRAELWLPCQRSN